jgi:large subunit ribosomal protein L32
VIVSVLDNDLWKMAVQTKKRSIAKKKARHSTRQTLTMKKLARVTNITKCNNCGADKLSHRVCPACGYYKGRQVMTIKSKDKTQILDA